MSRLRLAWILPFLLGVFFLSLYLLSGSTDLKQNGDTLLRYQTTQAIVDQHQLWLSNPAWMDARVHAGVGGHIYAKYGPGQSLFMAPLYVAGKVVAHHLNQPYDLTTLYSTHTLDLILGALLAVAFFLMARSLGFSNLVSVVLTLIFGLATPAWPDAQSGLEQTQVDLFLLLSVLGAWLFVRSGLQRRRWLVVSGAAIGLAFFTRYDAALFAPLIALYLAAVRRQRGEKELIKGDWVVYALSALPFILFVLWWNVARFGSPFDTGMPNDTFGEPIWTGFFGLTISPGKGILWYVPEILLLPWAIRSFYSQHRQLTWLFGALVIVPLLFYSFVQYWHGDPAWGPRYLYTSLPYLILPLGTILERWRRQAKLLQVALAGLVAASLLFQASAVAVNQWRFWYRLEAIESHTSQPFEWGPTKYHYYWTVSLSPILMQIENVYQVASLDLLGQQRYRYTARPTPCEPGPGCLPSNPADNYPINDFAFWWANNWSPVLSQHQREAIAGVLALVMLGSLGGLIAALRAETDAEPALQPEATPEMVGDGVARA
ncbi:MAG: ArnT family glycosyltransferase [Chloroflexota bacterium]